MLGTRWPLPALLTWLSAWALMVLAPRFGVDAWVAGAVAVGWSLAIALQQSLRWRRLMVAAGFPLSWLMLQGGAISTWPAWAWLVPLAVLAVLYPRSTWGDAPLFPTPKNALDGLSQALPLAASAKVLDAGCGLGDGLLALRREYPQADLRGLEWSAPLRWACAWRCGFAKVQRGDIWAADWSGLDVVYLFQRPESMPKARDKALRELRPGAWLVSLEFEVPGWTPHTKLETVPGKPVWLYQAPFGTTTLKRCTAAMARACGKSCQAKVSCEPTRLPARSELRTP